MNHPSQSLRWQDIELAGTHLIEASAGTGKTFTIGLITLRLLLEHGCRMPRIALITFTIPAASELADRLARFLRDALAALEALERGSSADPDKAPIVEALERARSLLRDDRLVRQRLENALVECDQARICTINSFCAGLLDEFAFELGVSTGFETIADEGGLVAEILADFWRREIAPRPETDQAFISHLDPEALGRRLDVLLKFPGIAVEGPPLVEQAGLWSRLCAAWRAEGAAFREFIATDPGINRRSINATWLPAWGPRFDGLFARADVLPDEVVDVDEKGKEYSARLVLERITRAFFEDGAALKEGAGLPDLSIFDLAGTWLDYGTNLSAALVTRAAAYLREELGRRKAERRLRSFADQISQLEAGLRRGGPASADAIRSRFSAVLVDEFQDTDALQFRIFSTLFAGRPELFFAMIGDPKQAIYRFRGGDINAYLQARSSVDPARVHTLLTNYRSEGRLLAALNGVYARHRGEGGPFRNPAIRHEPVLAGTALQPAGRDGAILPPVSLWDADGRAVDFRLVAERLAAEVFRLTDPGHPTMIGAEGKRRSVGVADMAILVGSHATARVLRDGLAAHGIRTVLARTGSVLASAEADQVDCLLDTLVNISDESRIRTLLVSGLYGWDLARLEAWAADDQARLATIDSLMAIRAAWTGQGIARALKRFFRERGIFSGSLAQDAVALAHDRMVTNFRHLMEILHQEDERLGRLPERTLHRFRELRRGCGQEEHEQRLESDGAAIQILTMHKSKGLQWPVVFAVELGKDGLGSNSRPIPDLVRDANGSLKVSFHPDDREAARETERRELIEERQRLAYVALTRAETLLYAVGGGSNQESPAAWLLAPGNTELPEDDQGPLVVREPLEARAVVSTWKSADAAAADLSRLGVLPEGFRLRPRWTVGSYSGLTRDIRNPARDPEAGGAAAPGAPGAASGIFAFPRGAEAGIALHAVLEKADFHDPDSGAGRMESLLAAAGYGGAEQVAAVRQMLAAVLGAPLLAGHPEFRLGLLDRSQRAVELEFHITAAHPDRADFSGALSQERLQAVLPPALGRIAAHKNLSGFLNGKIDLVFCWDKRWYILDWKSNHLGDHAADYSGERLMAAMTEANYHLQYLFYILALGRHLGTCLPDGYDYGRDFGGVLYLFVRGLDGSRDATGGLNGVFFTKPDAGLIRGLEDLIP